MSIGCLLGVFCLVKLHKDHCIAGQNVAFRSSFKASRYQQKNSVNVTVTIPFQLSLQKQKVWRFGIQKAASTWLSAYSAVNQVLPIFDIVLSDLPKAPWEQFV